MIAGKPGWICILSVGDTGMQQQAVKQQAIDVILLMIGFNNEWKFLVTY